MSLDKQGNSNYQEQTQVLSQVIQRLSTDSFVVLGGREFCSVNLGHRFSQNQVYDCLRLKRNTEIGLSAELVQQLQDLGLTPGQKLFLNKVRVAQNKGFGTFNGAAKWKRRYGGFALDEAWFIEGKL